MFVCSDYYGCCQPCFFSILGDLQAKGEVVLRRDDVVFFSEGALGGGAGEVRRGQGGSYVKTYVIHLTFAKIQKQSVQKNPHKCL